MSKVCKIPAVLQLMLKVSKMLFFSALLFSICSRVSTDFVQGKKVMECSHQDHLIWSSFTDRLMASEGSKVLFTFEADCYSEGICVHLCITFKEPYEKIESYIESNDVFVYRSSSNFVEIEAVIRSFYNYSYTHSLKEVEDLYECILSGRVFFESSGLCSTSSVDYGGFEEHELNNEDWCMSHLSFIYDEGVDEKTPQRIGFLLDEASEAVLRFYDKDISVVHDLPGNEDEDMPENVKYNSSPCEICRTTLWICNSTRNQAVASWCEITLQFYVDESDSTCISVSRIVKSSAEETSRLPSASLGETDTSSPPSSTRIKDTTSPSLSTRIEEMKPRGFGFTIGVVGVSVLLPALLILAVSCLVIKSRRKSLKTDKHKAVTTRALSINGAELVINPAYESADNDSCSPKLDGLEDVYNSGYERNTTMATAKKFKNQQNVWKEYSSSSDPDVPEEIYNPVYETSAGARDQDHMYHYVDIVDKEQTKGTFLREES